MRSRAHSFGALVMIIALAGCAQDTSVRKPPVDRTKLAEVNMELGIQYMQNREFQTAMDKLKKAIELNPRYVDAHNAMGLLHSALGQFDEAEASFNQALHIDPANASIRSINRSCRMCLSSMRTVKWSVSRRIMF